MKEKVKETITDSEKAELITEEKAIEIAKNKEKEYSKPKDGNLETVKSQYNKKYYIDTTTGEIIGGEQSEFFND